MSRNPLQRYSTEAPSRLMREFAAIALRKGHNQETLAKAMPCDPSAVGRHFESKRPRTDTVSRYAQILEIPEEYITLAAEPAGHLSPERAKHWAKEALKRIYLVERRLQDLAAGTYAEFRAVFKTLSALDKARVGEVYALEEYRVNLMLTTFDLEKRRYGLGGVAEVVKVKFDLIGQFRDVPTRHKFFMDLWLAVQGILDAREFEYVLETARLLLKAKGVDYAPMESYLRESEFYSPPTTREKKK